MNKGYDSGQFNYLKFDDQDHLSFADDHRVHSSLLLMVAICLLQFGRYSYGSDDGKMNSPTGLTVH